MNDKFQIIKDAFSKLTDIGGYDHEAFCKIVEPVAESYGAGLISAKIAIGKRKTLDLVFFDNGDHDERCQRVEYSHRSAGGGNTVYSIVSRRDVHWSPEEEKDILFLCKSAFMISEKVRLSEMADDYYYHDTVTGLYNMNGLAEFAAKLTAKGTGSDYCAAFINIVGFNYINKKVGYKNGTRILKKYSSRLNALLDEGEMAARLGGDNFVIIFKKASEQRIVDFFNGVEIKCRHNSGELKFLLSARAGMLRIDRPDLPFEKIMSYVSYALNYAKNYSHVKIVYFSKEIEQRVLASKEYAQKFRSSLDSGEFYVVFQPKVFTKDDTLYGAEALVRWNSGGKIIYPGDFIETLEKEHLVCELDFFVLEETCRYIRSWLDKGLKPVKISINFSNEHLLDDDLLENIIEIVDRYDVPHELIEVEMTETADVNEMEKLLRYVAGLHANGFTVAVDDFGMGYSSLHILQSVSVDVIKIDKSFVNDLTDDTTKRENIILKHIINMADELGVEIVAEGVENGSQRKNLTQMNCHRIQGYVYDKPLAADDFTQRLSLKNYSV